MSTLIGYITKAQLTVTQWVLLAMATAISGLVAALELQGSRLHWAQIQLLEQNLQVVDSSDDKAMLDARNRFHEAYKAYVRAKQ